MSTSQPPGDADEVVRSAEGEHASIAEPPVQCLDGLPEDLILLVVKSTDTLALCDVKAVGKAWCSRARQELPTRLTRAFKLSTRAAELQGQGRYHEAEPLAREAVELLREKLGDRHLSTLSCIYNLGGLLYYTGDLWNAYLLMREAVVGLREVLGSRHRSTLTCICGLGAVLRQKGDHAYAEPLYREVVEGKRESLGCRHPETLSAISNLGALLREKFCRNCDTDLADLAAAELLYREVLEVQGQTLGARHPDTVTTITTLASLLDFAARISVLKDRLAIKAIKAIKLDASTLRPLSGEMEISYNEYTAKKFVMLAIIELEKMPSRELDYFAHNDPDIYEVFERLSGPRIRATGTA